MDRREFLRSAAGFAAGMGLSKEVRAQQKEKSSKEKQNEMADIRRQAQILDTKEEGGYKKYIQAKTDSEEERSLFAELGANHRALVRLLDRFLDYGADQDNTVVEQAVKFYNEFDVNIQRRRKVCREAEKRYFDRPPAPLNPRPKE